MRSVTRESAMTATLTLNFEDGTSKQITLAHAVELDVSSHLKQSLEFRQTKPDRWIMSYTKPLFDGKKISTITFAKDAP